MNKESAWILICIVSKNFDKTLDLKREFNVAVWRHKQRTPSNDDHHMPLEVLLNKRANRRWYSLAYTALHNYDYDHTKQTLRVHFIIDKSPLGALENDGDTTTWNQIFYASLKLATDGELFPWT